MVNTIEIKDAGNNTVEIATIDALINNSYEVVAASQTEQTLGSTGAAGDLLSHLLVTPTSLSPGSVTIFDDSTSIVVFTGGADSVNNLIPFIIPLNMVSTNGEWKVSTGANISVVAVGKFT